MFEFLVTDFACRYRGRFIPGGIEIFYWNTTAGVRVSAQTREEFVVQVCPLPEGAFPPSARHTSRTDIEWFDAFDAVTLVTGRRPRFETQQLYGNDPAVITAYSSALRGPCRTLLEGDDELWARLRRQRRARLAHRSRSTH